MSETTNVVDDGVVWNDMILFGGAISCKLPMGYMDLSNIRQVPDHQECYMEIHLDDSAKEKPSSVFIMEILEQQHNVEHDQIIEYLFQDLAESNGIGETSDDDDNKNNKPRILFFQTDNHGSTTGILPPNELFNLDEATVHPVPNAAVVCRSGRGVQRTRRGKDFNDNHHANDNMETISIQLFVIRLLQQTTDILVTFTTPITLRDDRNDSFSAVMQEQQNQKSVLFQQIISSIQIHDLTLFNP